MNNEVIPSRDFDEVAQMIAAAKQRTYSAVNSMLVELYWQVGAYIHNKLESAAWGEGIVDQLAKHLKTTQPGLRGFTRRNLFRMRQFYATYQDDEKVPPLVTQLPWTHNLIILSQSKTPEEREFYLKMAIREKWSKRELERQFRGALFERSRTQSAKSLSSAETNAAGSLTQCSKTPICWSFSTYRATTPNLIYSGRWLQGCGIFWSN